MNRISAITVVRGSGECMAIVNGVVQEEIRRQQAAARAEIEEERRLMNEKIKQAEEVQAQHRRHLAARLREIERMSEPVKQSTFRSAYEKTAGLIAMCFELITGRYW